MEASKAILCVIASASLVMDAYGHGRLTKPLSRKGDLLYEDDPVRGGNTGDEFVCRHAARNTQVPYTEVTAGGELTLQWKFGAAHVGDCAVYVSYDVTQTNRAAQKYFKIANLPKCKDQNNQDVKITLPDWLPKGNAVLRWDWYGLHVFPTVEFYSQCVDIAITSQSTVEVANLDTYSIISPPVYPANGAGGGFRNAFGNGEQFMTGPACAHGYTGNNCALTAVGTTGNTRSGGGSLTGGGDTAQPVTSPPGGDASTSPGFTGTLTPMCEIYSVVAGDTLSAIAKKYTDQGKVVTWQQICSANGKSNCDLIDVGDNYVIPYEGSVCAGAGATMTTGASTDGGSGSGNEETTTGATTGNGATDGQMGAIGAASLHALPIGTLLVLVLCRVF